MLVWSNGDLGDATRVTNTAVVADALIVVPELDLLVFSSTDKVLTSRGDSESVKLTTVGAVEHTDGLAIEAVPVSHFAVRSASEELRLIWVVDQLLEHGRLEEAHDSSVRVQIPNDARSVEGSRNGLRIGGVDADVVDTGSVLFEGALHDLGLHADSPDADFTFHATGDDALAVVGWGEGRNSVVVSVVDGVIEFAGLGQEGSDLSVGPSGEDALSICHEMDGVALESWHFDTEKLLTSRTVPDTDVVQGASSEELRVASWESNIVDSLVMASVSQLRSNGGRVAPVDGGHRGSREEVGAVSSQRD